MRLSAVVLHGGRACGRPPHAHAEAERPARRALGKRDYAGAFAAGAGAQDPVRLALGGTAAR